MSRGGRSTPDGDDIAKHYNVPARVGRAIAKWIEAWNATNAGQRPMDGEDALKRIRDEVNKHNAKGRGADVERFYMDSEPYGDERIGYHLVMGGEDLYEDRLVYLDEDDEIVWTDWGSEYEAWEEAKYLEDPWPKIEYDGPQGGEDIQSDDFVEFWTEAHEERDGKWQRVKRTIFRLDAQKLLDIGLDPDDDDIRPSDVRDNEDYWKLWQVTYLLAADRHAGVKHAYWAHYHRDYFFCDGEVFHLPDNKARAIREWAEQVVAPWRAQLPLKLVMGPPPWPPKPISWLKAGQATRREAILRSADARRPIFGHRAQQKAMLRAMVVNRPYPRVGDIVFYGRDAGGSATFYAVGSGNPVLVVTAFEIDHGIAQAKVRRRLSGKVLWRAAARGIDPTYWRIVMVTKDASFSGLRSRRVRRK